MADLIRQMTVERGMDPREFALYAYGGAGGLHVAGYLRELGCDHGVIPLGTLSTTWSAYGCATSDVLQVYERAVRMSTPIDLGALEGIFSEMEDLARLDATADNIDADRLVLERTLEMKYPLQIHQVEVTLPAGELTDEAIVMAFTKRYEQLYGRGSANVAAAVTIVACRVLGRGQLRRPEPRGAFEANTDLVETTRSAIWIDGKGKASELQTRVLPADGIAPGTTILGPAIIEGETTTVAIPPGCSAAPTPHGDLHLSLGAGDPPVLVGAGAGARADG
jgi:N-methylhydantoinase A